MAQIPMKNQAPCNARTQAGSIFVMIFIMIALFAAISLALIQSSRTSGETISKDKAKLAATEILSHLDAVKIAIKQLIIDGCDETQLDFTNSVYVRNNGAAVETAPPGATAKCSVYAGTGANIHPVTFENYGSTTHVPIATDFKAGHFAARFMDGSLGTTENDLSYYTSFLNLSVCLEAYNLITGQPNTSIPIDGFSVGGFNSYTTGAAGSLNKVSLIGDNNYFVSKYNAGDDYCQIGVIVRAR